MEKTFLQKPQSEETLIKFIKGLGKLNIIFNIICTLILFALYNMRIETSKVSFVLFSCIIIYVDFIAAFIMMRFFKVKHKSLLLLALFRAITFYYSVFLFIVIINFLSDNNMLLHIVIFAAINIVALPINLKSLNKTYTNKPSKVTIMAGSIIPISGIIGVMVSKFFRATGNEGFGAIIIFYVIALGSFFMNKIYVLYFWQYKNYDKIYSKNINEVVKEWTEFEGNLG